MHREAFCCSQTCSQLKDFGGHCGVKRTLERLYTCVTWPNINRCYNLYQILCGMSKQAKDHKHKAHLQLLPIVGRPFQRIAFDIVGPYPHTKKSQEYFD